MSPLFTPAAGQDGALADVIASLAALRVAVKELHQRMDELEASLSTEPPLEPTTGPPAPTTTPGTKSGSKED